MNPERTPSPHTIPTSALYGIRPLQAAFGPLHFNGGVTVTPAGRLRRVSDPVRQLEQVVLDAPDHAAPLLLTEERGGHATYTDPALAICSMIAAAGTTCRVQRVRVGDTTAVDVRSALGALEIEHAGWTFVEAHLICGALRVPVAVLHGGALLITLDPARAAAAALSDAQLRWTKLTRHGEAEQRAELISAPLGSAGMTVLETSASSVRAEQRIGTDHTLCAGLRSGEPYLYLRAGRAAN